MNYLQYVTYQADILIMQWLISTSNRRLKQQD